MKYIALVVLILFSSCSLVRKLGNKQEKSVDGEESSVAYNYAFTEATKQKLFGNYSQALALLFKCIDVNPASSAAYYLISEIYLKNEEPEKALDYCRLAVKYDPRNNWYRLDLATLYKMNNKIDSAIYQYHYIVRKNPHNFKYHYNLAALYFEYGELWKSLKIIRKLFEDDKKNEELAITKFQIERKLKRYKSAERTLKKIYKRLPGEYKYLGLLAEHYKSLGKIKKGEKAYKELLANDSVNEIGIIGLATFYIESDRIAEAESLIRNKLINKNELNEIEIQFLINSLKIETLSDTLRKEFVSIIKNWFVNNPDNEIDLKNMSDVFVSSGYTRDLSELLEYNYNNKENFSNLEIYLMVLNLQDRNDDILRITGDSILSGQSSNYLFYYNGIGYYKKKMFKQAAESFKRGLNFMEMDHSYEEQMLTLLGESCYKLNEIEDAFGYFEKVLEINPYNLYVLNNYSYYLALRETSLNKAEEMSQKCVMMDKHNFNYLDTYGWVLFKKGKYKDSYEVLKKAMELGGKSDENVINHYHELLTVMNIKH